MQKVYVVTLNYKGVETTIKCVKSLKQVEKSGIELSIIVVDNFSNDGSVEKLRKEFDDVILIGNQKNLGFTGGCNEGMRLAIKSGADFIVLLNNDTVVDKDLIKQLVNASEGSDIAGVVPKIYFEKGFEYHKDKYKKSDLGKVIWYAGGKMDWNNLIGENTGVDEVDSGQFDEPRQVELATGCCFLIKVQTLKKIGLFDNRYFLYYEDADLSEKIKRANLKIIYEPKAIVWHKNAESSGGSGSDLQDYYISRNRLLFGMKYASAKTKLALIREGFKLLRAGRKWQKIGVRDYFLKKFGRGSYKI